MTTIIRHRYTASRGGHAPGHLRDWFQESIYGEASADMTDQGYTLQWLTGQLWNCSDIMPGLVCDELCVPRGSTYSVGARALRSDLDRRTGS